MTILFRNSTLKILKQGIFDPRFKGFYFLHQTLHEHKFEEADFKKRQEYFQILAPKFANQALLVPNLRIFVFAPNFPIDKFKGAVFKCDSCFPKLLPKTPN